MQHTHVRAIATSRTAIGLAMRPWRSHTPYRIAPSSQRQRDGLLKDKNARLFLFTNRGEHNGTHAYSHAEISGFPQEFKAVHRNAPHPWGVRFRHYDNAKGDCATHTQGCLRPLSANDQRPISLAPRHMLAATIPMGLLNAYHLLIPPTYLCKGNVGRNATSCDFVSMSSPTLSTNVAWHCRRYATCVAFPIHTCPSVSHAQVHDDGSCNRRRENAHARRARFINDANAQRNVRHNAHTVV